ncbi:MAG: dienelactone hydrolase family protein [Gemmatimonadota bacterium]
MSSTGSRFARIVTLPAALLGIAGPVSACVSGSEASQAADVEGVAAVSDTTIPAAILGRGDPPRGQAVAYLGLDEATRGYVSVPEGEGPFPAIILIHEWNGLVDRVRQVADALADEGYVAFAADLYQGRTGSDRTENMALMREARADPGAMIENLDAALDWVKARGDVSGRVGAVGWCFGGGVALSFGLDGADHDATAIFYGSLIDDPDRLASLSHEVYGTFGELDNGIPESQVRAFAAALRQAGIRNDIHVYEGVGHGFWLWVERDPEAATEPARDAWRRLREYFSRTLGD